jgi:hypothetical protein
LTTSLKPGVDFKKRPKKVKQKLEWNSIFCPDFQVGVTVKTKRNLAHPSLFKRERQIHEPQNEMMNKEING